MEDFWKVFEETIRWGRKRSIKAWLLTDDDDDDVSQEIFLFIVSVQPLEEICCYETSIQLYIYCTERYFSPSAMRSYRSCGQNICFWKSTSDLQPDGFGG